MHLLMGFSSQRSRIWESDRSYAPLSICFPNPFKK